MNVAQLIAELSKLPGDAPVILSADGEGDNFSPLSEVETAMYLAENSFQGEHYMTEEQRQAMDNPDEYGRTPEGSVPAVFLWPTN